MLVEKTIYKERITWVKGILWAKAKSIQLSKGTGDDKQIDFANSTILDSKITLLTGFDELKKNQEDIEKLYNASNINCALVLPKALSSIINIEDKSESFNLTLNGLKFIKPPTVSKVLIEDNLSFATYEGEVIGYITDIVTQTVWIEEPDEVIDGDGIILIKEKYSLTINKGKNPDEAIVINDINYNSPKVIVLEEGRHKLSLAQTHFKLFGQDYQFKQWSDGSQSSNRIVYLDRDKEITPIYEAVLPPPPPPPIGPSCLETLREVFSFLLLIPLLIIALFVLRFLWPFLLVYGLIYLVSYLWSTRIWNILRIGFRLLGLIFFMTMIGFAIADFFDNTNYDWVKTQKNDTSEVESQEYIQTTPKVPEVPTTIDTLIVQHRKWKDYDGNSYEMDIKIRKRDIVKSEESRNSFRFISTYEDYNALYLRILNNDKTNHFDLVYQQLDSIKLARGLDNSLFAKMIVTMVQDIPYVLILSQECDWKQTGSIDIKKMLEAGVPCQPNVKAGLYAPEEFLSNLKGDCDTRTLTIFKILHHYKYDVRVLNSAELGHSIIGINLADLKGQGLIFDNKKYTTWETTAQGIKPGFSLPNIKSSLWKTAIY